MREQSKWVWYLHKENSYLHWRLERDGRGVAMIRAVESDGRSGYCYWLVRERWRRRFRLVHNDKEMKEYIESLVIPALELLATVSCSEEVFDEVVGESQSVSR